MCEYCSDKTPLVIADFDLGRKLEVSIEKVGKLCVWLNHDDLYHEEYIDIDYCPKCGRELK